MFREHSYSPDFEITFDAVKHPLLAAEFKVAKGAESAQTKVMVDVKGGFNKNGGDRNFSINQKWMYQKHGIYVHKLVPKDFFEDFGVPAACLLTKKTKKPRKAFQGSLTLASKLSAGQI